MVGDIPPEKTLTRPTSAPTGATSITDCSTRSRPRLAAPGRSGGQPVLLLNGQRISSFREMRDNPDRGDPAGRILPEEVALNTAIAPTSAW